jgi:acetyl esterase/lipase
MRTPTHHQSNARTDRAQAFRLSLRRPLGKAALVSALALLAGCASNSGDSSQAAGASAGPPVSALGGASSLPASSGGSSAASIGGTVSGVGGALGASGGASSEGGSPADVGSAVGGTTSQGGSSTSQGGSGAIGTGARGGATSTATGGASTAAGGSPSGPITAPVRDTASKVPISSAPGNTVEANYAYGPLTAQRLDVIYPPGAGPKGTQILPVVLMFHGGAWIHSYNNDSGKDHMTTFFDRYLKHGFMVCNAEYRVSDGSPDAGAAPAAVQDALLAAKWCWDHLDYFHGDKTKYVVTGASAGGHLALMVGMTTPAAMLGPTTPTDYNIAAIVSGYGPADIEAEINKVAAGWLPPGLPNRLAIAHEVNPINYVRASVPPLIVVQGANDTTAPVPDSEKLVMLLKAAGADASIHLVPGATHGFTDATWPDAEAAMFNWLVGKGIGK